MSEIPQTDFMPPQQPTNQCAEVYYSAKTQHLVNYLLRTLGAVMCSESYSPFQQLTIIVPNSGLQRYLELKIAKQFGICANIEMLYPKQFIWRCYQQLLKPNSTVPVAPTLNKDWLIFAILEHWQKDGGKKSSTTLSRLLATYPHSRQRYWLANRVAMLLMQYLQERPDWIRHWCLSAQNIADTAQSPTKNPTKNNHSLATELTINPHSGWQQKLFIDLGLEKFSPHTWQPDFYDALSDIVSGKPSPLMKTPVFWFGFHELPPSQLREMLALSHVVETHVYTFNPSTDYWQDIVPEKVKLQGELQNHSDESDLLSVGHQLLASFGQAGKALLAKLNEENVTNIDDYVNDREREESSASVLDWLQQSIRYFNYTNDELPSFSQSLQNAFQHEKTNNQYSITINAVANHRREVEVLHDQLCELFDNTSLNPVDVLVIVPEISDYAPFISSIFSSLPLAPQQGKTIQQSKTSQLGETTRKPPVIPFSLVNTIVAEASPDAQAFLSLLSVIDSDFLSQTLMDFLAQTQIKLQFQITDIDLVAIRQWLQESRQAHHLYDTDGGESGSLEKLLDMLLLCHVGGEDSQLGSRTSADFYHPSQQESLMRLSSVLSSIEPFTRLSTANLSIVDWLQYFQRMIDIFLPDVNEMQPILESWKKALELDEVTTGNVIYDGLYDFQTILVATESRLQNEVLHGPFLSGGVSFGTMASLRLIPAKVIYVLGLNADYPEIPKKNELDLCQTLPRQSDNNSYKTLRYHFLETLMAAEQQLVLSYKGVDEQTGKPLPPSSLVSELTQFIERYQPSFSQSVTRIHPLQGFMANCHQSYQTLYQSLSTDPDTELSESQEDLEIKLPSELSARQLATSLFDPLAFYFQYQLGANMLNNIPEPLRQQPFIAIDPGLDRWVYLNLLMPELLATEQPKDSVHFEKSLKQKNLYAPDPISPALLREMKEKLTPLVNTIKSVIGDDVDMAFEKSNKKSPPLVVSHELNEKTYWLRVNAPRLIPREYGGGYWEYSTSPLSVKKLSQFWLTHVILQCHILNTGNKKDNIEKESSHWFTLTGSSVTYLRFLPFEDTAQAHAALNNIINFAMAVLKTPYDVDPVLISGQTQYAFTIRENRHYPQLPMTTEKDISFLDQYITPINDNLKQMMKKKVIKDLEQ